MLWSRMGVNHLLPLRHQLFFGSRYRTKKPKRAREVLGDRAVSQGGLRGTLLNELFVFGQLVLAEPGES